MTYRHFLKIILSFGCVGSSLLQAFSSCIEVGPTLRCGAQASYCSVFSCCGARILGT